ncbi:hypothetical protein M011DRAFT_275584 [Sporormia fimetaria CBS 119925]|uniref:Uncharacterized protein n=1 Tax=Sporormia fimetaria CBS 119925 TaxID=1340428 RepID=A0A6A6VIV0_9PLEO|nr:hypothetical protein M011DRAFT_275584 [Sporormia fimetaria CBS 119925]
MISNQAKAHGLNPIRHKSNAIHSSTIHSPLTRHALLPSKYNHHPPKPPPFRFCKHCGQRQPIHHPVYGLEVPWVTICRLHITSPFCCILPLALFCVPKYV